MGLGGGGHRAHPQICPHFTCKTSFSFLWSQSVLRRRLFLTAFHLWPRQMFSRTPYVITDVKIKKIRPDFSNQQIHSRNGAISFSHKTSPEEFGFEATSCHCIMHPTVHHFTRNMHAHIRKRKISCSFFFFTRNKNCHRHVDRFGDVPFISLVCNRPRSLKKIFSLQ